MFSLAAISHPPLLAKEQKSAWDTWDATNAFLALADRPMTVARNVTGLSWKRFVVLMHDKQSELYSFNGARQHLFSRKCQTIENIPPTHLYFRAEYPQSSISGKHVWGQVLQRDPVPSNPAEWGMRK